MRYLVDTDAFCKLAVGGVLNDAVRLLGADLNECGRLPALPYMLRKGQQLRQVFGPSACDALIPIANSVPVLTEPSAVWLDKLTPIKAIDPGEAWIFAAAAERSLTVVSGDKRALRALKDVGDFQSALTGRIVVLEAILISLCNDLGPDEVRQRVQPLTACDKAVKICFSDSASDPREDLLSYFNDLARQVAPLILWDPRAGGVT